MFFALNKCPCKIALFSQGHFTRTTRTQNVSHEHGTNKPTRTFCPYHTIIPATPRCPAMPPPLPQASGRDNASLSSFTSLLRGTTCIRRALASAFAREGRPLGRQSNHRLERILFVQGVVGHPRFFGPAASELASSAGAANEGCPERGPVGGPMFPLGSSVGARGPTGDG